MNKTAKPRIRTNSIKRLLAMLIKAYPVLLPVVAACIIISAITAALPAIFQQKIYAIVGEWTESGDWASASKLIIPQVTLLAVFYVISLICSLLGAGGSMLQVGVLADIGAELTYKHNKDLNNYTISFLMLPLKLSLILRSALITGVLGITGYTAWLADGQPDAGLEAVRNGFSLGYCVIPAILAAIAGLAMLIIYKLPEEKAHEYVMANKKAAEENEARVNAILAERGEL